MVSKCTYCQTRIQPPLGLGSPWAPAESPLESQPGPRRRSFTQAFWVEIRTASCTGEMARLPSPTRRLGTPSVLSRVILAPAFLLWPSFRQGPPLLGDPWATCLALHGQVTFRLIMRTGFLHLKSHHARSLKVNAGFAESARSSPVGSSTDPSYTLHSDPICIPDTL